MKSSVPQTSTAWGVAGQFLQHSQTVNHSSWKAHWQDTVHDNWWKCNMKTLCLIITCLVDLDKQLIGNKNQSAEPVIGNKYLFQSGDF